MMFSCAFQGVSHLLCFVVLQCLQGCTRCSLLEPEFIAASLSFQDQSDKKDAFCAPFQTDGSEHSPFQASRREVAKAGPNPEGGFLVEVIRVQGKELMG